MGYSDNLHENRMSIVLCITVILNIYAQFLQNLTGINSFVFVLLPLVAILLYALKQRVVSNNSIIFSCSYILALIPILQMIIIGPDVQMVKYIIYVLLYLSLIPLVTIKSWLALKKCFFIIGIMLDLDAIVHIPAILSSGLRIFNIKNMLILDKPYYSLFLTITIVILLIDLLYEINIKKGFAYLYIFISSIINILFMQSKSSLACLGIAVIILLINTRKKIKRKIIFFIFLVIFCVICFFIIFPNYVPDYINAFFYYLLNMSGNPTYDRYNITFDHRSAISQFIGKVIRSNPLLGIGFGNYKNYTTIFMEGYATQTESSLLNLFVEGGCIYGGIYIFLNLYLLYRLIQKRKYCFKSHVHIELLIMYVLLFIFNIQNDFISVYFWIIFAVLTAYTINTPKFMKLNIYER